MYEHIKARVNYSTYVYMPGSTYAHTPKKTKSNQIRTEQAKPDQTTRTGQTELQSTQV
jgi:hypothetical protein